MNKEGGKGMEIYIKPAKKVMLNGKMLATIGDICDVYAAQNIAAKVKAIPIKKLKTKPKAYLITIIDLIAAIQAAIPGSKVVNVGESETLLEARPTPKKENAVWKWSKIMFVVIVLFVGSATAIMSFHSDAQMPKVFENYHRIFFGESPDNPFLIDLPYSLGLAVGIIVFFNHFAGRKITMDPTPIEVEMSVYEAEVTDTMLGVLNAEQSGNGDENG